AKAESLGISCSVGMAERAERLIILLVGTGLYGLGLNIALPISLTLLTLLSLVTVLQRLKVVYQA
ncbi:MAG: CDP-alcohol phosphatidyltransferase family protein, partial [Candidatus Nanopelagicaceae bacterium]